MNHEIAEGTIKMSMQENREPHERAVDPSIPFREIPEGAVVELMSGARGEVVGNPGDGAWLLLRIIESADDEHAVGSEELVFFSDVKGAR